MEHLANTISTSPDQLALAWKDIETTQPGMRIREAAKALDASEAQLLATTVGEHCIRLHGPWPDFLKRLPELGYIMSLTRNDACILEHKGHFDQVNAFGKGNHAMATVIGPIETRVFFSSWHVAFAVRQEKGERELISLQIFDRAGEAITKIYLQQESHVDAYHAIVRDFRDDDQRPEQSVPGVEEKTYTDSAEIDQDAFLSDWDSLRDTHDFFPMLRKHHVHRYQALELAAEKYTYRIVPEALEGILRQAAKTKLPIMIFAGNRGNLQIHQDRVRTIRMLDRGGQRWLNVLDPEFNMHLLMDLVATAWVVKKPTDDGMVTAIELFDAQRNLVAQFFGLRKPGTPQLQEWASLVAILPRI